MNIVCYFYQVGDDKFLGAAKMHVSQIPEVGEMIEIWSDKADDFCQHTIESKVKRFDMSDEHDCGKCVEICFRCA